METKQGSPSTSEPVYLVIGKIRRPHGVVGEVLMEVITDFPERIQKGARVFIGEENSIQQIRSARHHNKGIIVSFQGYDLPEEVGIFRNQLVKVQSKDAQPLEEGEYYHHELIGLRVVDIRGRVVGSLVEILETGANDVFIVKTDLGKEILLPVIDEVIENIDVDAGLITVNMISGLENQA